MRYLCLATFLLAFSLSSCSLISQRIIEKEETKLEQQKQDDAAGASMLKQGKPTENPLRPDRGVGTNYNVSTEEELLKIDNGADGPIYFTDPDNPDKEIEGINEAFSRQMSVNRWLTNYRNARRLAVSECKPLLIWFHDSVLSPKSRKLGTALLETTEFEDWASENAVRVRLDAGLRMGKSSGNTNIKSYSASFVNGLASQYGLRRKPALAVIAPDGYIAGRVDGYNGDDFLSVESDIKEYVKEAQNHFDGVKQRLETKGYRTWHGKRSGDELFACFMRFDPKKNIVYLKEFTGRVRRVRLNRLSLEDQEWVEGRHVDKKGERKRKNAASDEF